MTVADVWNWAIDVVGVAGLWAVAHFETVVFPVVYGLEVLLLMYLWRCPLGLHRWKHSYSLQGKHMMTCKACGRQKVKR